MSDNVVDIQTRRGRPPADAESERAREREANRRQELASAPAIAERLKATPRIDLPDRAVFAGNLHRLWEEARSRNGLYSLRGVFEAAFGEDFEAKYKKSKRFVCLKDEEPSDGFAAHGADFVRLAEAIAKLAYAGQPADAMEQAVQRAILALIVDSSFDDRRPPEARLRDAAVASLIKCCDRIVRNVEAEVDLDSMCAVIDHDAVAAVIDGDGEVARLCEPKSVEDVLGPEPAQGKLWDALQDQGRAKADLNTVEAAVHIGLRAAPNEAPVRIFSGDLYDAGAAKLSSSEATSPFAPRVVMGDIYSREHLKGAVVMLKIDEVAIEREVGRQAAAYGTAIDRHGLADEAPPFDRDRAYRKQLEKAAAKVLARRYGYPDDWISENCKSLYDLGHRIEEDGYDPPQDPWTDDPPVAIVARRRIELKLLKDYTTGRWRLCLSFAHGVRFCTFGREGVFGSKDYNQPFCPSFCLGPIDVALEPPSVEASTLYLHRLGQNRFMLYAVADEDLPSGDVLGIHMGWLSIPSEPALDALFTEIEDNAVDGHSIGAPLDRYWNKPAPAKSNTLAAMILRNLAYAPEEERYDLCLLKDAKRKAEMAREFADRRKSEFETAIRRLDK